MVLSIPYGIYFKWIKKLIAIASRHATTGVKNHPVKIFFKVPQLTVLIPFTIPTPNIAPITAWEVDTGTPTNV